MHRLIFSESDNSSASHIPDLIVFSLEPTPLDLDATGRVAVIVESIRRPARRAKLVSLPDTRSTPRSPSSPLLLKSSSAEETDESDDEEEKSQEDKGEVKEQRDDGNVDQITRSQLNSALSNDNPVDGDPTGLPLTFANLSLHSNSPPPSRRASVSDILSSPEWSSVDSETRKAQDEADDQALVEDLKAIDRERRERAERQGTYPFLMPRYSSWYSVESDSDSQVSDRDVDGGEEEQNGHPVDDDATSFQRAFGDLSIHSDSPSLSPQPSVHGLFSGPEFSSEDSETERARYAAEMQEVMDDLDAIVRERSARRERAERERALPSAPYDFGSRDPALRSRYLSWDCDHEPNDIEEGNYDGDVEEGEESDVDNDAIEDDADPEVGEDAENEAEDEDHLSRPSSPEVTLEYEYDENDSDCSRISFITTRTYDMLVTMKKWGLPLPKGFK